jgi:glycosyltransferase involved in cell wall biosynthesis
MKNKLSVVLATYNEEKNLGACLESVKDIASEIIVVDGSSTDNTREIAASYGAIVIKTTNPPIFHINKEKALRKATSLWVLQLDADERVTKALSEEISKVIDMSEDQLKKYQEQLSEKRLFERHKEQVEQRDGKIGKDIGGYSVASAAYKGFFIPRLNYFLGKYLRYGGVYPDGVIRLVKKDSAHFPQKSVHEQIIIDGQVGWLANPLLHLDGPTFTRYLQKNSRYIDLIRDELKREKLEKNPLRLVEFFVYKPFIWFFLTQIRHKGILDGWQGIIFSLFSALRFPRAYWRYLND